MLHQLEGSQWHRYYNLPYEPPSVLKYKQNSDMHKGSLHKGACMCVVNVETYLD